MLYYFALKLIYGRSRRLREKSAAPDWKAALVISWSDMRGIVTLATALALPENFPERSLILFTAFAVTLGTLVIQGMTLRALRVRLAFPTTGR